MLLPLASISRRSARPKTQTDHPHQPKVLSCETCLSVETENFAKKAKDGRLPWFPDSSKIADIVTKLRNAAPQITYVLSVLGTEWGEDLAAREILFREKLYDTAFLDQLWPCETCKHAEQLPEVQQEIQLCGHVRSLRNFIEGRLNSNEQTIPKVKDFLDKLKVGLLDEKIAAAISPEQDQNVDWSEVEFVKVELGSILNQTRQCCTCPTGFVSFLSTVHQQCPAELSQMPKILRVSWMPVKVWAEKPQSGASPWSSNPWATNNSRV